MKHHAQLERSAKPLEYECKEKTGVLYFDRERFGIDDVRALQHTAHLAPTEETQTIVVRTLQLTLESQHALLKLLEEPPAGTSFVLVLPPAQQLLDTVMSRLSVANSSEEAGDNSVWVTFEAASYKERLLQIDTWHKKKDETWLQAIRQGLLGWVTSTNAGTASVQLVTERLGTRGASNKMLLELLALELPIQ